ncbi:hypothetical protein F0M16_10930 [Vibrio cholerae]|uniref:Uncharacterized protein n=1 Tax=Vibrio cholerae TaxID=666 RepID=A0A5Q6PIR5_VIBCL|nr:hypothetical protein [Vibrio cholerae]KAA1254773.1 hypothetical protein F0M16_10930 [Vibrio cholerae]
MKFLIKLSLKIVKKVFNLELKPVKTYVVWNPSHVASVSGESCDTYQELLELEASTGYSFSSIVEVPDIEQVINAILSESYVSDMKYQEI